MAYCGFMFFLTVFRTYQDDGRVIVKDYVQCVAKEFLLDSDMCLVGKIRIFFSLRFAVSSKIFTSALIYGQGNVIS